MVFEKLDKKIVNALKKFGIEKVTPIQEKSFSAIYSGINTLLISPTGTGKTLAALIPIFQKWIEEKPKPISILYITPMKSLNRDQLEHLLRWGKEIGMEMTVRHGDTSQYERKLQTEFPHDMMIITLETLQPILTGKKIREHLRNVKWVILDEVHEIYDSKRGVQLSLALERLKQLCGDFQLIMLSATVGNPKEVAKFFGGNKIVKIFEVKHEKPMKIKVVYPRGSKKLKEIAEKIFSSIDSAARLEYMIDLIKRHNSVLVFTNTREFAEILTSRIKSVDKKLPVSIHHSSLSKNVRIKAENDFKKQKIKALVCTSSLQLGIDIGSVDLVIQYMSPREVTQLVQRVGRSGHGVKRVSKGIIIAVNEDDLFESAVIAKKALKGELETPEYHEKPYDVLAHQIVGLAFDFGKIEVEKAFDMIKNSYPYKNLKFKEFLEVLRLMDKIGLIFLNEHIKRKRRSFKYYFTQLSTIPDVKQYKVFNIIDNSFVGVLDEEFVAVHGDPETTFILKGETYKIVSIENDKVLVEPAGNVEAAIPAWEGELIPVSFEVAQEVAKLRKEISDMLDRKSEKEVLIWIKENYPVDENGAKAMIDIIKKQKKIAIPTDKKIVIEYDNDFVVIHAPFGTKVNETLGRFLAERLSLKSPIGIKIDQYRIAIHGNVDKNKIKDLLENTDIDRFRFYTEQAVVKSEMFSWKFVHVAKRFGVISRDAELKKSSIRRLIEEYKHTPVYEETLKELMVEKLDLKRAEKVLNKIKNGEITIEFVKGISPLAKITIEKSFSDILPPEKPKEIFESYKSRLMNKKVKLVCMNCGKWEETFKVSDVNDEIKCRVCGARLIAITKPSDTKAIKIVKKHLNRKKLSKSEKEKLEKMMETAELFINYGRKAVISLAAKGVGPRTARRVLSTYISDEDDLIKKLIEAEKQFFKTRKYWSI